MRHALTILATLVIVLSSLNAGAQELSKKEKEPWAALETQVALWFKQDWDNHDKYIHPKGVFFMAGPLPVPVSGARTKEYFKILLRESDQVVTHYLAPVNVTVVDDVAIINCYLRVLKSKNGELLESTYRLHNTWKKENGHWLLLATCNAVVEEDEAGN